MEEVEGNGDEGVLAGCKEREKGGKVEKEKKLKKEEDEKEEKKEKKEEGERYKRK